MRSEETFDACRHTACPWLSVKCITTLPTYGTCTDTAHLLPDVKK